MTHSQLLACSINCILLHFSTYILSDDLCMGQSLKRSLYLARPALFIAREAN